MGGEVVMALEDGMDALLTVVTLDVETARAVLLYEGLQEKYDFLKASIDKTHFSIFEESMDNDIAEISFQSSLHGGLPERDGQKVKDFAKRRPDNMAHLFSKLGNSKRIP